MKKRNLALLCLAACMSIISCQKEILQSNNPEEAIEKRAAINPNLKTTIGKNVQEFTEQVDPVKERERLGLEHWLWADFEPTGFYVPANTNFSLTVDQLQGSQLPTLLIGTYYLNETYTSKPTIVQLNAGNNTLNSGAKGGILWIRYGNMNPTLSKVRITFNSGHQKVPTFIKGITTQTDWNAQLSNYPTPDVLLVGDRVMQVYRRSYAQSIASQDNNYVLQMADQIWDWENQLMGLDNSAPQHRDHAYNRVLMVQDADNTPYGAYAYFYGTSFGPSTLAGAFTPAITTNGWGMWHEMGHLHQQYIWTWSTLTEVTVNIYALHVERKLGILPSRLKVDNRYGPAFAFINNTSSTKDFNTMTGTYDDHFTRLVMFHQLYLAFGEQFYINLNKRGRLEPRNTAMTDKEKMSWFMKTACEVSGRNLTTFFRKWGFRVDESVYATIAGYGYPNPTIEPSTLSEDNTSGTLVNGGIYKIISLINNSSVIDVNSTTPVNGTAVTLWTSNTGNNQKWLARKNSDGTFVLKSMADTTKVLDVPNSATSLGTAVKVWSYGATNNQKWKVEPKGNNVFSLAPAHAPSIRLDVNNGVATNGTSLIIWSTTGNNNQNFRFDKLN